MFIELHEGTSSKEGKYTAWSSVQVAYGKITHIERPMFDYDGFKAIVHLGSDYCLHVSETPEQIISLIKYAEITKGA